MRWNCLVFLVFATLCFGCRATSPDPHPLIDRTLVSPEIRELHNKGHLAALLYPDKVHSYWVEKVDRNSGAAGGFGEDYRLLTQGPDLSKAQIDHLRRLYIDMRGYGWLQRAEAKRYFRRGDGFGVEVFGSGCEWKPDVVLEYVCDDQRVRVVLCFGCSMWAFESDGRRYYTDGFADDTRTSGLQPMLRATVVELFPTMMNYIPQGRYY